MCAVGAAIDDHNIKAIIVLTISGDGARQIARFRPSVPVIVVTRDAHVARCMHLYRGLFPLVYKAPAPDLNAPVFNWNADIEARLEWAMREAKIMLGLLPGDGVILVHGERSGSVRTNTMRIVQIGSS